MLITCVILMMIDVVMQGQGRVTRRTMRFLLIKLFCQPFCICSGVVVLAMEVQWFWFTITWSFMVQTLKILIDSSYRSRIVRGQSTLKDVVERNTYRLMTTFFEIGVCPWPDLSSLFQFSILSYPAHRV